MTGSKAAAIACDVSKASDINSLEPISGSRKPDEMAAAVLYSCVSAAAFMVGNAMVIDRGLTASLSLRAEVHGVAVASRATPVRSCDV